MFPSCVIDEYAVSKTFLILYRNEEIILDDQIIFKISTIVNAFNVGSFHGLNPNYLTAEKIFLLFFGRIIWIKIYQELIFF